MTDGPAAGFPRRLVRAEQVLMGRTRRVALAVEASQDPRNVHAVLRSAEAFGIQDVHLVAPRGESAAISPGVTQRAHEWLTVRKHATLAEALAALRSEGRQVWAAHPAPQSVPLTGLFRRHFAAPGAPPVAVVFGNETEGLSDDALAAADLVFRIDLVGFSGSLNLSVAAGIVLWELRREEVVAELPGDLPDTDARALRRDWFQRLVPHAARRPAELETILDQADGLRAQARTEPRVAPRNRAGADLP